MKTLSKEEFENKYGNTVNNKLLADTQKKSPAIKIGDILDTVFGSKQIGDVIGADIAKGTFGKTLQKLVVGRELSPAEEATISSEVTTKQLLGDLGKVGLTLATAGGLGTGGRLGMQALKSAGLGASFGATQGMKENEGISGIVQNALTGGAIGGAIPPVFAGAKFVGSKALDIGEKATGAKFVGSKALDIGEKAIGVAKGGVNLVEDATKGLSRIPSNIATNVAERQSTLQKINALPTKTAQIAVRDGVDIKDVNTLINIPTPQRKMLRPLLDSVKRFAEGTSKQRPEEVVGRPIVQRIKQLETQRLEVGKKLGDVANNLGMVTKEEVLNPTFNALKRVNGLGEIKLNPNGILNFDDTTLATEANKSAQKQIQSFFSKATSEGTGKSKHLLRQEIFEILGGKKRSLSNITDTEEKAFDAIRKGLSDALENKNPLYKSLSNDFRKTVQPLQDLRKFMKNTVGATEDVLDMQAGLLARRLTSNAPSNPQLRNILKSLDTATKVKGKTMLSTEALQDFYNVLNKYYDISAPTGFQGQIKTAIPTDIIGKIMETVGKVAGETDAVRQKALENLVDELLNFR